MIYSELQIVAQRGKIGKFKERLVDLVTEAEEIEEILKIEKSILEKMEEVNT